MYRDEKNTETRDLFRMQGDLEFFTHSYIPHSSTSYMYSIHVPYRPFISRGVKEFFSLNYSVKHLLRTYGKLWLNDPNYHIKHSLSKLLNMFFSLGTFN